MMPVPGTSRRRPAPQCGRQVRGFQRRGQDWYCAPCMRHGEPCAACGKDRPVSSRDRAGRPRCAKCPDDDGRDPVTVIHGIITALDPGAGRETVAGAVRQAGSPALIPAETGMGAGREPGAADRGRASRAAARDPAVHRDAPRRGRRRGRPPGMRALRPRGAHRQAAGRRPGLPDLHRALPHRAVRALRSRPRARHPRRARPAGLRELLRHRPGEPGDLHRLRPRPPGRAPDRGRAALLPAALPSRSWPARSAARRRPAGSPGQPGCHGARPASADGPRARPADATSRSPPAR